jgi:hypothetical protein
MRIFRKNRLTKPDEIWKQVVILLLSLVLSLAAAFWTSFSRADQILLTIGLFMALLLIDIIWLLATAAQRQSKEYELWQLRDAADVELANVRHHFAEIAQMSHGGNDIFVSHFMKEIHDLSRSIKDAADKQELRTASDFYIKAKDIFGAFLGDPNPVLRYTWPISESDKLFEEPAWFRFFEVKARMVEQKEIKGARALLILDGPHMLTLPRIVKLLDFFHTNPGQECRIIMKDAFQRICTENNIPCTYLDFGIYGQRMLFRSEQYAPEYIGVYTKDTGTIQAYSKFFDTLWDSPAISKANPSVSNAIVSIQELMAFDTEDSKLNENQAQDP